MSKIISIFFLFFCLQTYAILNFDVSFPDIEKLEDMVDEFIYAVNQTNQKIPSVIQTVENLPNDLHNILEKILLDVDNISEEKIRKICREALSLLRKSEKRINSVIHKIDSSLTKHLDNVRKEIIFLDTLISKQISQVDKSLAKNIKSLFYEARTISAKAYKLSSDLIKEVDLKNSQKIKELTFELSKTIEQTASNLPVVKGKSRWLGIEIKPQRTDFPNIISILPGLVFDKTNLNQKIRLSLGNFEGVTSDNIRVFLTSLEKTSSVDLEILGFSKHEMVIDARKIRKLKDGSYYLHIAIKNSNLQPLPIQISILSKEYPKYKLIYKLTRNNTVLLEEEAEIAYSHVYKPIKQIPFALSEEDLTETQMLISIMKIGTGTGDSTFNQGNKISQVVNSEIDVSLKIFFSQTKIIWKNTKIITIKKARKRLKEMTEKISSTEPSYAEMRTFSSLVNALLNRKNKEEIKYTIYTESLKSYFYLQVFYR